MGQPYGKNSNQIDSLVQTVWSYLEDISPQEQALSTDAMKEKIHKIQFLPNVDHVG